MQAEAEVASSRLSRTERWIFGLMWPIVGLKCFVEGKINALAVVKRILSTIHAISKRADGPGGRDDGMGLDVDGDEVIAGQEGAHGFKGVVGIDVVKNYDDEGVGVDVRVQSRCGFAELSALCGRILERVVLQLASQTSETETAMLEVALFSSLAAALSESVSNTWPVSARVESIGLMAAPWSVGSSHIGASDTVG